MIPIEPDENLRARRLRSLIALEISRIVEDLQQRRDFLVQMWSLHRDRTPFLETLSSRWASVTVGDLLHLDEEAMVIVEAFYREVDEFRLYVRFTQDMPVMLSGRYDWMVKRLDAFGEAAITALGGAPRRPTLPRDEHPDASLLKYTLDAPAAGRLVEKPAHPHPADEPDDA